MQHLLPIFLAASTASCVHLMAERERFRAIHGASCVRHDAEINRLIEQAVAAQKQAPSSTSEETPPETSKGALSKGEIRAVISGNIAEVRNCYEEAMRGWPYASGRVVVKFVIDPHGDVERVAIDSNATGIDPLACCIAEAVRSWHFPAPRGGGLSFPQFR